jgi:hypothetical protein
LQVDQALRLKELEQENAKLKRFSQRRPALLLLRQDVHRADFIAITAPSTPPAFSINNFSDGRILISRAALTPSPREPTLDLFVRRGFVL